MEHESNHFFVTLGAEDYTGLPALFMYCHSLKDCNAEKKHEMLAFVDPASYETLGIDCSSAPTALSMGQTIMVLGKIQEQVDRLIENPGGAWDTVIHVGFIACALCTAASGHELPVALARTMLNQLLTASGMSEGEKQAASFGFGRASEATDPVGVVRAYAAGLSSKREQELMMIREAITAHTDPALRADVPKAADALLVVLDYCERRDTHGKVQSHGNFADLGLFFCLTARRTSAGSWSSCTLRPRGTCVRSSPLSPRTRSFSLVWRALRQSATRPSWSRRR